MFGERAHGRVEEGPTHVELDVFGALRFQRHVPLPGHDASATQDAHAAPAATVQIAATAANTAAATAADTTNV